MGTSLNFSIIGFVGSDPSIRTVQTSNGEQTVASFSVAISRKNGGGQKQTLWIRVNCWGRLSEIASQYVRKSSHVMVTGSWLRPSAWVDQSGNPQASIDIDADRLILLDRANNESEEPREEEQIPF